MARRHSYRVAHPLRLVISAVFALLLIVILVLAILAVKSLIFKEASPTPTVKPTITAPSIPTPSPTPTPTPTPSVSGYVIRVKLTGSTATVRIRKQPSTTADILGEVSNNITLPYLGESGDWWIVKYQNQTGYLLKTYGKQESATASPTPTKTP